MHSPFRSESDVFRVVVGVLAATTIAVGIGALSEPWVGGVLAGLFVGIAIGLALRAGRGSIPADVENAEHGRCHRILVIANQTVTGSELIGEIANRASGHREVQILVVSPALTRSRLEQIASDTDLARHEATERLRRSLVSLQTAGFDAVGRAGDEDPVQAAADALREFGADEIIVSTHPPSRSRWLERGVVEQIRARFELPLTHVVVEGAATADRAPV